MFETVLRKYGFDEVILGGGGDDEYGGGEGC